MLPSMRWHSDPDTPRFELVPTSGGAGSCPPEYRDRIVVDTLHDGGHIPGRLLAPDAVKALEKSGELERNYISMRDWGADLLAHHIAEELGLAGHYRVNVARVVMDFNRFPGMSPPHAGPMQSRALSGCLAESLGHADRRFVLEECYDAVSASLEEAIFGRLIKLSIHTYDEHNPTKTLRPEVSILSRSHSYQQHSRLPYGLFDPLFPDVLVESSAKPILRDRLALTLEKAGNYVEHNYPYCLPDGSLEIRCQPWFFFQHARQLYELMHPDHARDPAFARVWEMLLNTNLRRTDSGALAGYVHRFQRAPDGQEAAFAAARQAYEHVAEYLADGPRLVHDYRRSPNRTSAITIEVRKDLVYEFANGVPVGPRDANAKAIAGKIAEAITTYLVSDR